MKGLIRILFLSAAVCITAGIASAQIPMNTTTGFLRAKAEPDECWFGIGKNIPFLRPPCIFSIPKVNQAYMWAMTSSGNDIWFGTFANPQCLAQVALVPIQNLIPYQTSSWACEFEKSPYVSLLGALGDFRPPQIFVYNRTTRLTTELTPKQPVSPTNPLGIEPALYATRGIRAATTIGNLILLAGPNFFGGLNFFAFRADTKAYLGTGTVPGYNNIRQMIVVNNVLYIPVGITTEVPGAVPGGKVLRWRGTVTPNPCNSCFLFDVVGNLDAVGASVALHQGRLFVSTWPTGAIDSVASLMMSPVIPPGGLTTADAGSWRRVWDATRYEPDRVIAASYSGGALASFGGYLYWGTMHAPLLSTLAAMAAYPNPTTESGWLELLFGTFRTASIFRGRNFDAATPEIQLLYGMPYLPVFKPASGSLPNRWDFVPNNMPAVTRDPIYGPSGFSNPYNGYAWNMEVWDNRLWIGTMDWSKQASEGSTLLATIAGIPVPIEITAFFSAMNFGGDLYFFQDTVTPAVPEDNLGLGNVLNMGVRNMIVSGNLFIGTANTGNIATVLPPKGGWELIELEKKPGSTPITLLRSLTCTPAAITGAGTAQCTATINRPASNNTITVGVVPILFDATPTAELLVNIPNGLTSVTFPVQVTEAVKPARLYVVAGLNGGTMVAGVNVNPGVPRISGAVINKGVHAGDIYFVDLRLTNTGTGAAQQVNLTQITPRTLTGTGNVTYAVGPGLSPAVPIAVGAIPIGESRTIRLYFNVPSTVARFSISESGNLLNLGGTTYTMAIGQSIIR